MLSNKKLYLICKLTCVIPAPKRSSLNLGNAWGMQLRRLYLKGKETLKIQDVSVRESLPWAAKQRKIVIAPLPRRQERLSTALARELPQYLTQTKSSKRLAAVLQEELVFLIWKLESLNPFLRLRPRHPALLRDASWWSQTLLYLSVTIWLLATVSAYEYSLGVQILWMTLRAVSGGVLWYPILFIMDLNSEPTIYWASS